MKPEYLEELADLADPDQLWRRSGLGRLEFTPEQKRQCDAGVALRRHASHVRRLGALLGTGKSLLITPLSPNGADVRSVPTPDGILSRLGRDMTRDAATSAQGLTVACPHCGQPAQGWSAKDVTSGYRWESGAKVYHCRAAAIAD